MCLDDDDDTHAYRGIRGGFLTYTMYSSQRLCWILHCLGRKTLVLFLPNSRLSKKNCFSGVFMWHVKTCWRRIEKINIENTNLFTLNRTPCVLLHFWIFYKNINVSLSNKYWVSVESLWNYFLFVEKLEVCNVLSCTHAILCRYLFMYSRTLYTQLLK